MVAFKRALALGLAVTALSQVSYASTGLDDKEKVSPKLIATSAAQSASACIGEPIVAPTKSNFKQKLKNFFKGLSCCTSAAIEIGNTGLQIAGEFVDSKTKAQLQEASKIMSVVEKDINAINEQLQQDASIKQIASTAIKIAADDTNTFANGTEGAKVMTILASKAQ